MSNKEELIDKLNDVIANLKLVVCCSRDKTIQALLVGTIQIYREISIEIKEA